MKRDMDLTRKILFVIEDQYKPGGGLLFGINVDGYDLKTIAEHCDLLHQQGLIKDYKPIYGDNTVLAFQVGNLLQDQGTFAEIRWGCNVGCQDMIRLNAQSARTSFIRI